MFQALSERFTGALTRLSGRGTISESNVREAMAEVRTALLEADVEQSVVTTFCDETLAEALGSQVTRSLKPSQEMVGIVHRRLVALMGPASPGLALVEPGPTVIMLCGLQGSGKTTTCGKLAAWFKRRGTGVLVCGADLQRPAAVEQLRLVVESVAAEAPGSARIAFHGEPELCAEFGKATGASVGVCRRALERARKDRFEVLILDTAGRLHIDDDLMRELKAIDTAVEPHHRLLVVDAMSGQDAVRSAGVFHERLAVDGLILSKFDSDARGGAALSARTVTGASVRFVGTGERFDALEEFHPERAAGRILGMGDVVSLVERAKEEVNEAEAEQLAAKMAAGKFGFDDLLGQIRTIRRMGPLKQVLGMLPGVGAALKGIDIDDAQFDRLQGMVHSMTPAERSDASLLDRNRMRRVARGSGVDPVEVGRLVKQFESMSRMGQQMAALGGMGQAQAAAALARGGPGMLTGKGSSRTPSIKDRFKKRR